MAISLLNPLVERVGSILVTNTDIRSYKTSSLRQADIYLPMAIISAGRATHEKTTDDMTKTFRQLFIRGLVKEIEAGYELEAEEDMRPLLDAIIEVLQNRPGLWVTEQTATLDYVQDCQVLEDSGFAIFQVGQTQYAGFEITLEVELLWPINQGQ